MNQNWLPFRFFKLKRFDQDHPGAKDHFLGPPNRLDWSLGGRKEHMQNHITNKFATTVVGMMLFGFGIVILDSQRASAGDQDGKTTDAAATRFLIVGKGKIADPVEQQQRGIDAVQKVMNAVKASQPEAIVDALAENVMTIDQYRRGQAKEMVTGAIFRERLKRLTETATPQDTVVIYTHSHGRKNGFEDSQPLGGLVMDLPVRMPQHAGTLFWDEYVDLLLEIPAKNVVVLTMSCFSGGLVDHLNSQPVLERWKERQQKEGRNLIVLTSQDEKLTSDPIVKENEIVNPFTYAVAMAMEGKADGFTLAAGKPVSVGPKNNKISVGEMIDFILYTTENTVSETARRANTAKPKVTGSFNRDDVLFELIPGPGSGTRNNSAQQGVPDGADKPRR